jgi:adenylate cyclase
MVRRLAAIMFTDMVGFTAKAQADERGTLRLLEEQEGVVAPLVAAHDGRTVKSTGDGALVEFPSALQAVECAVEIQQRLHARNQGHREGTSLELRIGIHLGDVESRGSDIFGDAVNIASRVQPLADPGGVVVSQQVYDQVRNKGGLQLEPVEPRSLKGVRFPMDLYRIALPWERSSSRPATADGERRLAVLPFTNISPDPQDAYISDGLTEEVITVLSQLGELRVIARTSVDTYRTGTKPIPQIGVELGVSWILEGSVRKAGSRLRITAQLIDVRTQAHLWASTYDRELDDVFAVQSEMAKRVAEALEIRLHARDEARLDRRHSPNPESYLEYLQGRSAMHGVQEADLQRAKAHFERALALDERNAAAHAGLADVETLLGSVYYGTPRAEWSATASRHTARALELDPDLAEAHTSNALALSDRYDWGASEEEFRRAIQLNPSYAGGHLWYAALLAELGRPEEALRELALAEELDPLSALALAQEVELRVCLGQWEEAAKRLERLGQVENQGLLYLDRRASLAVARDDVAACRESLDRLDALLPDYPALKAARAGLLAREGDRTRALEILRSLEALPEPKRPDGALAWTYLRLGDLDRCFHWLEVSRAERRFNVYPWRYEARAAPARADPRYAELLRKMHLPS